MSWQGGRQLAGMTDGAQTLSLAYNEAELRTEKTVGNVSRKYIWNDSQLLADVGPNDAFYFHYNSAGDMVGYTYKTASAETECLLVKNPQGDVERVISTDGTVLASYSYDAWGRVLTATGTLAAANPIRYRGYYYDAETGLYYLNSRYYSPEFGRFISPDVFASTGQGLQGANMYAYCGNNPGSRIDTSGGFWDTAFDVVSLCFSIAEVIASPADPWAWIGLAGDVIDLVPFVTGVGETAKAVGATVKHGDDVLDLAKGAKQAYKEGTGVYEILFTSGKNYVGKGGFQRMIDSGKRILKGNDDEILAMMWKPAKNNAEAFIGEYLLQTGKGVLSASKRAGTYNQIWSPGRKLFKELF